MNKKITITSIVLSMFLLFVMSCNQEYKEYHDTNSAVFVENGIEYYIQTDKYNYDFGDSVSILYRITNKSSSVMLVGDWPNLCAVSPVYIKRGDKDIYKVPSTPYAITKFYLDPDESCECAINWEMDTWPEHKPVVAGIYTVVGDLEGLSVSVYIVIK